MTAITRTTDTMRIQLAPNEILINVVQALNGHVSHLTSELDVRTTCIEAIKNAKSLLENDDRELTLHHIRTRCEKEKLKELAEELIHSQDQQSGALTVQNAIPANQLPSPRRATAEEKGIMKENFRKDTTTQQPYALTHASLEAQKLVTVAGHIRLSAIDGDIADPSIELSNDSCLWDTGAQYCSITSDIVNKIDPSFLQLKAHEAYKMRSNMGVQVDAMLSLSNRTFEISTIFLILPSSDIPNKRSGVILGQHGFLNRIMVETIPKSILLKRGEEVGETVWGEIRIKAALDLFNELREFD